ncbi:unnamed protein product, partial [Rotaria socialis]
MGDEINATVAGRVVTNIAKLATNKVSELLTFSDNPVKTIPSNANRSLLDIKPNQSTENS